MDEMDTHVANEHSQMQHVYQHIVKRYEMHSQTDNVLKK